jgi:hypothetical protein
MSPVDLQQVGLALGVATSVPGAIGVIYLFLNAQMGLNKQTAENMTAMQVRLGATLTELTEAEDALDKARRTANVAVMRASYCSCGAMRPFLDRVEREG